MLQVMEIRLQRFVERNNRELLFMKRYVRNIESNNS